MLAHLKRRTNRVNDLMTEGTRTKSLAVPHDNQSADFVELFFDLVFVFAITQITHLTVDHLGVAQVLKSALVFWLLWWGWTQFTWALNAANTRHPVVRMVTLIATAVAFVMATAIDQVFTDGVMWFAVSYVLIRLLGLGLFLVVTRRGAEHRSAVVGWALLSLAGMTTVLVSTLVSETARLWWLLATIGLDMGAGFIAGRSEGWYLRVGHFVERHGLIVIIALGESLIVAASAVTAEERSLDLLVSGGLVVLVTCLLWWSYFAWTQEHIEEALLEKTGATRARLARDVFSFMHFPLICGIIGVAIGFEKILGHPHDPLSVPVALALGGGVVLFVGFTAASVWKSSGVLLTTRLVLLAGSMVGVLLSIGYNPSLALGIISAGLAVTVVKEWRRCGRP